MTRLRVPRLSALTLGAVLIGVAFVAGVGLFNKQQLMTTLKPGETLRVDFERDYRLRDYISKVKIAGVQVGVVTGVERAGQNARVKLKLDRGTRALLGEAPSARIRPATLLGGTYYVELVPGGDPGRAPEQVPADRTTGPVELDRVLEQIGPEQREGIRTSIAQLDTALRDGGTPAVKELVANAPGTLVPAGEVLQALRGNEPQDDLTDLVTGLEATARALTADKGALDDMLSGAGRTAGVLADQRSAVASTLDAATQTLATTRAALSRLDTTLAQVRATAPQLRSSVRSADALLGEAQPVLAEARPVVQDLRVLARDLRPTLADSQPLLTDAKKLTGQVRGPVIDRLSGPVLTTVLSPYRGSTLFFQEVGYMIAGLNATTKTIDGLGSQISFQPGFSASSLAESPYNAADLIAPLIGPSPRSTK